MSSALVIGGGIAGLTAAFRLQQAGIDVRLLEAAPEAGGVIRSTQAAGYLTEHGPNALQHPPPTLTGLLDALGLTDALVEAAPAARFRYVVRDGRPVALPTAPPGVLTTSLLSTRGKLRLLREPFVPPRRDASDESVASFVRRRLGPELLDYAVDPFVAGTYAGDPEQLAVRHAFPRLFALEQEHGSLLRGAFRSRRARPTASSARRRGLFSFRDGLQTLPDALARSLGPRLHLGTAATGIARADGHWRVTAQSRDGVAAFSADAVVWAAPLHRLSALGFDAGVDLAPLRDVFHAPIRVAAFGFRREDVEHPLDGFGLLVPAVERAYRILGVLFSSTLFPHRAPDGHVLLTVFLGGARHPDLVHADDRTVERIVRSDLASLLGAHGDPTFRRHVAWPHAIPQYGLGYARVHDVLTALEARHRGLAFAGSYRGGISVSDAATSGDVAAQRVLA